MAKAKRPKKTSVKKSPAKKNKSAKSSVSKASKSKSRTPVRKSAATKGKIAAKQPVALKVKPAVVAVPRTMEDKGNQELSHSGWVHQVRHEAPAAEADFRKALQASKSVFAQYGLAKALMQQGKKDEATKAFEDVASQLEGGALKEDKVRADMLRRQCIGYVQLIKDGRWDLSTLSPALP